MAVPNTFGTATSAIPLSQLDANFNTPITLGNTAIQLGDTVTTLNNMTLANVTISSGNVTITNVAVTTANVSGTANISTLVVVGNETVGGNTTITGNITAANANVTTNLVLSGGTANGVAYLNTSKVLTTGSALVFDGTNLLVGATSFNYAANGVGLRSSGYSYFTVTSGSPLLLNRKGTTGSIVSLNYEDSNVGAINTDGTNISLNKVSGITFPATQSASTDANTLDDYEEGTWTPNLFSAGGANPTFTSSGVYTKVGNLVTLIAKITLTSTAGSIGYYIDGFPFGVSSTTAKETAYATETTTVTSMAVYFANTTTLFMVKYDGTFYGASGYDYRICLQFTV
jgi:hypothetical protein